MTHARPFRVLAIETSAAYGGAPAFLQSFLNQIDRDRFRPIVAFYDPAARAEMEPIRQLGLEMVFFGPRPLERRRFFARLDGALSPLARFGALGRIPVWLTAATPILVAQVVKALRIAAFLVARKVDLLLLNNDIQYHVPGILAGRLARVPIVLRKAGIGGTSPLKRLLSPIVDTYIAISRAAADEHLAEGLAVRRMITIEQGVDLGRYSPASDGRAVRKALGIADEHRLIGCVALFERWKGHHILLRAATRVAEECPEARFVFVGDDRSSAQGESRRVKALAHELGLGHHVLFPGWWKEMPAMYAAIDIAAQCSIEPEGLSVAAVEEMASGKPMVVSNSGGLAETVVDGETGFVVPLGDPDAVAAALIRLVRDRALAARMGAAARARAEKHFDIRGTVRRIEETMVEAIERHRSAHVGWRRGNVMPLARARQ